MRASATTDLRLRNGGTAAGGRGAHLCLQSIQTLNAGGCPALPFLPRHGTELYPPRCWRRLGGAVFRRHHTAASVLISILITFLVIILVLYLVQRLPIDAKMRQIVQIIDIVIGIIALLKSFAVF